MANAQIVTPKLTVVGHIAYCLQYADNVAGLDDGEYTAWIAWQNTRYPHSGHPPSDVAVPCWFRYVLDGVNLGHVVWWVPSQGKFFSSPYRTTMGHAELSSIAEIEQLYRCTYVGWSEDISGLRVAQERGNMTFLIPDEDGYYARFAKLFAQMKSLQQPDGSWSGLSRSDFSKYYAGKDYIKTVEDMSDSPEAIQRVNDTKGAFSNVDMLQAQLNTLQSGDAQKKLDQIKKLLS